MVTLADPPPAEAKIDDAEIPQIDRSLAAEASSAHSRINIPINLGNWKTWPTEVQNELTWFHQYLLDKQMGWQEAEQALGYDRSTVFKILKGTYDGNLGNVVTRIQKYRWRLRKTAQHTDFAENAITKLVFAALDYAVANHSMTIIVGESRAGKTTAGKEWAERNNHGRSVFITAPVTGGAKGLLRRIAAAVGVARNKSMPDMIEAIYRAFNPNRILIVDEAHRLLPNDTRVVNPVAMESIRDLHDETGCAVAFISTKRLPRALKRGAYQYEQLEGRCGQPVLIPRKISRKDIVPIVTQFVSRPGADLLDELEAIANKPGRLGIMVEMLRVAKRIASKKNERLADKHIAAAIRLRDQMTLGDGDE